jgi:thiamine biosynthesis lipoprotein
MTSIGKSPFVTMLLLSLFIFPLGCDARQEHIITGRTMGTTYHITVVSGYFKGIGKLQERIDARLEEVNQSMSTYIPDSEISRFNSFEQLGVKFAVSPDFFQVLEVGQKLFQLSNGAWDATVQPLVDLWGFGPTYKERKIPRPEEIAAALPEVGFDNIELIAPDSLVKKIAGVTLDLSSIAKGFGVDQVAKVIEQSGFENYLVEIGGEIFAAGVRSDGKAWRIGISRPQPDAPPDEVYKVVGLSDRAFATSGDYRNFFEAGGVRYSHVMNPKTGYPVSNGVVSVSVMADSCTFADGLATTLMVMGPEKGLELVSKLDKVECLIVVQKPDGSLVGYYSPGFKVDN